MEEKQFKKIVLGKAPTVLLDESLELISGGKQNKDENGNWDTNTDHAKQWMNDMYHTKFYMQCPNCGTYMFYSMEKYGSNAWWYCFWYNRLYCYSCKKWTEELY